MSPTKNPLEIDNLDDLQQDITLYLARNYLIDFITTTYPNYQAKWFHELICKKCDDFVSGKIKKLMVFMPPQHGKSEIVTRRLIPFILGKDPRTKAALVSFAADKASKFNREIQRIIDDPVYRAIFPKTFLNSSNVVTDRRGSWLRNSVEFETVGYGGGCKCVGVEGPLTGDPVDVGIIDDPIKDHIDAFSPTIRERVWNWYISVFKNRLHNFSRQLIMLTRWHEDDLPGRLLNIEDDWEVISIPRIKEPSDNEYDKRAIGEVLWEEKHSLKNALEAKALSERLFASMQQQRPAPTEGGMFKEKWFRYYTVMPSRFDRIIQSWDCAFKGTTTSDYVVCTIWGKIGADSYLLGMSRGKFDFVETVEQVKAVNKAFPYSQEKLVEEKANGAAVISVLSKQIPGLIPINPEEGKESRAYAVSFVFEAGNVYFPANCQWVKDVEQELKVFPNGKNDDIVDSISQALRWLYIRTGGRLLHMSGIAA